MNYTLQLASNSGENCSYYSDAVLQAFPSGMSKTDILILDKNAKWN